MARHRHRLIRRPFGHTDDCTSLAPTENRAVTDANVRGLVIRDTRGDAFCYAACFSHSTRGTPHLPEYPFPRQVRHNSLNFPVDAE